MIDFFLWVMNIMAKEKNYEVFLKKPWNNKNVKQFFGFFHFLKFIIFLTDSPCFAGIKKKRYSGKEKVHVPDKNYGDIEH